MTSIPDLETENARLRAENARLLNERDTRARFFDQFMGVVGHDLRSPLSAIQMAAALLGKAPLDERGARALLRIQTSSKRAERLIRDLVDSARVTLGDGIALARAPLDLHEVTRQMIDELLLSSHNRRVTLSAKGLTQGEWDANRMGQIVSNLVTYALRGSPPDTDVRVEVDGDDREVRLIVCSHGDAIDAAALSTLFEPFAGGAQHGTKAEGLALFIVAQIVAAHGGHVEARSSPAEGTTLIAHLPR